VQVTTKRKEPTEVIGTGYDALVFAIAPAHEEVHDTAWFKVTATFAVLGTVTVSESTSTLILTGGGSRPPVMVLLPHEVSTIASAIADATAYMLFMEVLLRL
jgi:hypothetical protein